MTPQEKILGSLEKLRNSVSEWCCWKAHAQSLGTEDKTIPSGYLEGEREQAVNRVLSFANKNTGRSVEFEFQISKE